MNKLRFLSLILLLGSIFLIFLGFLNEEIDIGIFFIFPFIVSKGFYGFLGIILLFLAIFSFFLSFTYKFISFGEQIDDFEENKNKTSVKGGGVVLIGPIPIVIGSNWKIALILMIIAVVIITILTILHFY